MHVLSMSPLSLSLLLLLLQLLLLLVLLLLLLLLSLLVLLSLLFLFCFRGNAVSLTACAPSRSARHPRVGTPRDAKHPARLIEVCFTSSVVTHGAPPSRVNIAPFPRVVQFVKGHGVPPALVHEAAIELDCARAKCNSNAA